MKHMPALCRSLPKADRLPAVGWAGLCTARQHRGLAECCDWGRLQCVGLAWVCHREGACPAWTAAAGPACVRTACSENPADTSPCRVDAHMLAVCARTMTCPRWPQRVQIADAVAALVEQAQQNVVVEAWSAADAPSTPAAQLMSQVRLLPFMLR